MHRALMCNVASMRKAVFMRNAVFIHTLAFIRHTVFMHNAVIIHTPHSFHAQRSNQVQCSILVAVGDITEVSFFLFPWFPLEFATPPLFNKRLEFAAVHQETTASPTTPAIAPCACGTFWRIPASCRAASWARGTSFSCSGPSWEVSSSCDWDDQNIFSTIDVPNSHWLVDFHRRVCWNPLNNRFLWW